MTTGTRIANIERNLGRGLTDDERGRLAERDKSHTCLPDGTDEPRLLEYLIGPPTAATCNYCMASERDRLRSLKAEKKRNETRLRRR